MPIREPAFWSVHPASPAAVALAPAGWLYGLAVRARFALTRPYSATVPVMCIGNPVLGGAGKTPTAIEVVTRLKRLGAEPHVQTRGYGGRLRGPVLVDPDVHTFTDVGDEPLLLARHCPVWVAGDRRDGVEAAAAAGAGIVVMDDGYQNPTVSKTASLLVVDGRSGIGNGLVFPAGPLREPVAPQIARASAVVVIGDGAAGERIARLADTAGVPVLRADLVAAGEVPALQGRRVFAFCGIARPEKFRRSLEDAGADVAGTLPFPDHHGFSAGDVARVLADAEAANAQPVTTEKDRIRLNDTNDPGQRLRSVLAILPVEVAFRDPGALDAVLRPLLSIRGAP